MKKQLVPPGLFLRIFGWFADPHVRDHIEGDLIQEYLENAQNIGKRKADFRLAIDVLLLFRRDIIRRNKKPRQLNSNGMLKNYFIIGWRNLFRSKGYSVINIGGLAIGMTIAALIGLWVWDELSFNKHFMNYDRIAQVMQSNTINGNIETGVALPIPLAGELKNKYGSDFKTVVLSSWTEGHVISADDKKIWKRGNYIEPEAADMLSLKILAGSKDGLKDPYSMMINESMAKALFGDDNSLNKIILIDNSTAVKVTAVFQDLPWNSEFANVDYLVPWELNVTIRDWVKTSQTNWTNNSFQIFVQLSDNADVTLTSAKIKDSKLASGDKSIESHKPDIFLQPMSRWHLYSEFKNGINTGGRIQFVQMFSMIGLFVLLLACINFMNLSTARSEKRAKEVGIRMTIGSARRQLICQFLIESFVVVMLAFTLSMVLLTISLGAFNDLSDKRITIDWTSPVFWTVCVAFIFFTSILAGSYPAFYLSAFKPVKVLRGTFKAGRLGSLPRKSLVVLQFAVSISLIIGTAVIFQQISFTKDRPIGYDRSGLVYMQTLTPEIHNHYPAVRDELIQSGAVEEMAESESPLTAVWNNNGGFSWTGKDPNQTGDFATIGVTHDFGRTVGWRFEAGRDFSTSVLSDSNSLVINEAAVKFMGLKDPVGETIFEGDGKGGFLRYRIIGVIKDMVMDSPYEPAKQTLFYLSKFPSNFINIKLNPNIPTSEALTKVESIFKKYSPSSLFDYKFASQAFAAKFAQEERIGKLASLFATLAVFISCLGLFGVASYAAAQRAKEIGVRKVMGASLFNLWRLLSKDFVFLVILSACVSAPVTYYYMNAWLNTYAYHTELHGWIFFAACAGALTITLLTVSFHSISAAIANPVKSLRSE